MVNGIAKTINNPDSLEIYLKSELLTDCSNYVYVIDLFRKIFYK
jgi:hypothetical protein